MLPLSGDNTWLELLLVTVLQRTGCLQKLQQ